MLDKYETELRLAHAFLALALVVVGLLPLAAIGWGDASLRLLGLLTLPLDAILIGLALRARSETLAEKDLALRGAGEGLTLSPSGVRVNIALTEGAYRDWLRKGRHPIGELRWDEIEALRIEPATSQPKSSTPAYFKLTLRKPFAKARWWEQTHGAIFILRRPFRGRENEIVEYVKAHAGLPIELYDTLR